MSSELKAVPPCNPSGEVRQLSDGCVIRAGVYDTLYRLARRKWGTFFPHLCPVCRQNQELHAFDSITRTAQRQYEADCEHCGSTFLLNAVSDKEAV